MLEHSRIIQECNGDYVVQHAEFLQTFFLYQTNSWVHTIVQFLLINLLLHTFCYQLCVSLKPIALNTATQNPLWFNNTRGKRVV
jgi:hypothetical protein